MTRKHFTAIAMNLNATGASAMTCRSIAHTCAGFNSNFDFDKFMEACGHGGS